jgi:hypothetical protein
MESVIEFFNYIINSLQHFGDNTDVFWERAIVWCLITYLEIKLYMMQVSYDLASSILDAINISGIIGSAFSSMDSSILGAVTYLRIPEAINIILSAMVTRFVMDLSPI